MELGPRELMTLVTVLSGLAATWGMVRTQLGRAREDLNAITKELAQLNQRLDIVESTEAVQNNKLDVHATINSVASLDKRARFEAETIARLAQLEAETGRMHTMHNTVHLPVPSPSKD